MEVELQLSRISWDVPYFKPFRFLAGEVTVPYFHRSLHANEAQVTSTQLISVISPYVSTELLIKTATIVRLMH